MKQQPCTCGAYSFPHRKYGGNCCPCRHGLDWRGLSDALDDQGEWCDECAAEEGYQGERSETLSAAQRSPSVCGR